MYLNTVIVTKQLNKTRKYFNKEQISTGVLQPDLFSEKPSGGRGYDKELGVMINM